MITTQALDVFIVCCDRDIKLLRHFFLSYRLFFKIPGDIHLFIWKKDQGLLDQIESPANLYIHYKDEVQCLIEDDFRNQMYLKLIANNYVKSEWFWVVDADFLICRPIEYADFFKFDKPIWYYRTWLDVPERSWRVATEYFLGANIPYLFMDEPLYVLNSRVLSELQKDLDLTGIFRQSNAPSEFIIYGAYAHSKFNEYYNWINVEESDSLLVRNINQVPPTYVKLDESVSFANFADDQGVKVFVFWSHWDIAENKIVEFLVDAQINHFGCIETQPAKDDLHIPVDLELLLSRGLFAVDGCYADGWVKRNIKFSVDADVCGIIFFVFKSDNHYSLTLKYSELIITSTASGQDLTVCVPLRAGNRRIISFDFDSKFREESGRSLFAKIKSLSFVRQSFIKASTIGIQTVDSVQPTNTKHLRTGGHGRLLRTGIERNHIIDDLMQEILEKERVIQQIADAVWQNQGLDVVGEQQVALKQKESTIQQQAAALQAYRLAYGSFSPLRPFARIVRRVVEIVRPRVGNLNQYAPRPLATSVGQVNKTLGEYPSISIVTPSFGQGKFIERTLLSILGQRYPRLEYFVQDGKSKDDTVEVLKKHEIGLSGWISEKDSGQSQAINLGFAKTSGEIMAWLNSDDLLMPGSLHVIADYFHNHPDIDVVYGNRLLIDENDMEIGRWILPGHDSDVLSWADYVPQETLFWRRRIWEKVGGKVDESFRFAMDWDLLVRFRDAGAKFGHIPQFLGAFRIHEHQKTSAAINEIGNREMDRIRERIFGRVPDRKEIRKAVLPYLIKHIAFDMVYRVKKRLVMKA
jgi:glycosyltransferase involved in cell wall biosynthesis